MLKSEINALLKSKSDTMKEMSHGCTSIEWKCVINRKNLIDIYNDGIEKAINAIFSYFYDRY